MCGQDAPSYSDRTIVVRQYRGSLTDLSALSFINTSAFEINCTSNLNHHRDITMDPIRALLDLLKTNLPAGFPNDLEASIRQIFDRFALVPKHEYEAHLEMLASLNAQVETLEARLAKLETEA